MTRRRRLLIESLLDTMKDASRAVSAGREQCFKHFKLHPAQVRVLHYVMQNQPVAVKDIAQSMGTTSSASTQVVDAIVDAGYLTRTSDPSDRRRVVVRLSAKGTSKFRSFRADHLRRVTATIAPLSDRDIASLITLLGKVTRRTAARR